MSYLMTSCLRTSFAQRKHHPKREMEELSKKIREQLNQEKRLQEEFRRPNREEEERGLGRTIVAPDPTGEGYILILNRLVPFDFCDFHTAYIGKTGSGKNLGGFDRHQLSYFQLQTTKPKYFLHLLAKENPSERLALKALARRNGLEFGIYQIHILNRDSIGIDIGGTIAESRSPRLTINQLSEAMFPQKQDKNPFFPTTSAQVTSMLILGLRMIFGRNFGLPEIVDIGLSQIETIVKYMRQTERGRQLAESYFPDDKSKDTAASIDATIKSRISKLESAASIEYVIRKNAPSRLLTVRQLITGNSRSTVFFAPTEFMDTYQPILNFVTNIVGSIITSLSADNSRIIVMFVDEFPALRELRAISQLVTLARATGFRIVLVFQDLVDLDMLYSKKAESILGNCGAFGIFNGSSPRTTKFISDLLGSKNFYIATPSISEKSINYNFARQLKPNLEAASIYELNPASRETGISAYVALPNRLGGVQRVHIEPSIIDRQIRWFQELASSQQALDAIPVQSIQRPSLFSDSERMQILKTAFNSDRLYQAYMEGYEPGSPRAKIRQISYQIMKRMIDKDNQDLFQIMRNYQDDE